MNRAAFVETRLIIKSLMPVLLMVAAVYLLGRSGVLAQLDRESLSRQIADHPLAGNLVFIALASLLTATGTPRQLIAFSGGYLEGVALGTVISTLATTVGAVLCYFVARLFLSPLIERGLFNRWPNIGRFLRQDTFRKTLIIRLSPVGNNMATNVLAGSSATPPLPFAAGSFLGYLPQMLIFSLTGAGVSVGSDLHIVAGLLLICVSIWLGVRMYRKSSLQQTLEQV